MTFLNPIALVWVLLAVPVVLLYLWRIGPRRRSVSTGVFWERVYGGTRPVSLWWWWRHPASLGLQLVLTGLIVASLAELDFRPAQRVILVMDNSASMNATDGTPSRLDQARQLARQQIDALRARDEMAIVSAGGPLSVECGLTGRRDLLREALGEVRPTRQPTRVEEAVRLARRLLAGAPGGRIVVVTDGCFEGAKDLAAAQDVQLVCVGGQGDNLGITALAARRLPADALRCQLLAEVRSFAAEPVSCRLEIALDEKPIEAVPVELAPGARWQRVFEMASSEGGRFTARLDRPDVLLADNRASAFLAPRRVHEVMLVTEGNVYLEEVLRADAMVRRETAKTPPAASDPGTVLVLDRQVPVSLPAGPLLVVDPAGPSDWWELGEPVAEPLVAQQADVPLLDGVRLEGLSLTGARRLGLNARAAPLAEPLAWTAEGVPLVVAIHRPAGRMLVVLGSLEEGDLALDTAFPILMSKAIVWLAGDEPTGEIGPGPETINLPPEESDVRVPASLQGTREAALATAAGPPFWTYLVAALLALLVIEWFLFQRRWTC